MPGSFDYDPYPPQLALDAIPIGVFSYDSSSPGSGYSFLPNLWCEQIQYKEGIEPPAARFSYVLDEVAAGQFGWPSQFEQIWPLTRAPSPYVVGNDDELVVLALLPDGTTRVLFHGFARIPQTNLSPANQGVSFVAVGVAILCWNIPVGGRIERDADDPQNGSNVQTDLPVRFNPAGTGTRAIGGYLPNCTPDGYDVGETEPRRIPFFSIRQSIARPIHARSGGYPRRCVTFWRPGIQRRHDRWLPILISECSTRYYRIAGPFRDPNFSTPAMRPPTRLTTTGFATMMRPTGHGPRSSPSF